MDQVIDKMGNWPMNLDSSEIFERQGLLVRHDTIIPYFNVVMTGGVSILFETKQSGDGNSVQ